MCWCKLASRLGLMHMIATNMCVWMQQSVASILITASSAQRTDPAAAAAAGHSLYIATWHRIQLKLLAIGADMFRLVKA